MGPTAAKTAPRQAQPVEASPQAGLGLACLWPRLRRGPPPPKLPSEQHGTDGHETKEGAQDNDGHLAIYATCPSEVLRGGPIRHFCFRGGARGRGRVWRGRRGRGGRWRGGGDALDGDDWCRDALDAHSQECGELRRGQGQKECARGYRVGRRLKAERGVDGDAAGVHVKLGRMGCEDGGEAATEVVGHKVLDGTEQREGGVQGGLVQCARGGGRERRRRLRGRGYGWRLQGRRR
jgi:hypothetical protein